MCAYCEPARELVISNLKDFKIESIIKSNYTLELLLSLSRGSKILKQILCEEPVIIIYL